MPSILNVVNMCSHLSNACRAQVAQTSIKNTKFNLLLALAMHRAGFFSAVYRGNTEAPSMEDMVSSFPELLTTANVAQSRIWVGLKFWQGQPVLSTVTMVSTSKRLKTAKIEELEKLCRGQASEVSGGVLAGLNVGECMFVGTSQGVLEAREALQRHIGGLLLCRAS